MFQTELNLFLQSHGTPFWDAVWWVVSELGRTPAYVAILLLVSFGVDLRRGWWLGVALLWTAGLTQYAKLFLALPRPLDVDSRVIYPPAGGGHQDVFTGRGATRFLAPLPADVVDYYRARAAVEWGLPSGHTACFSAFAGGLSLLFWGRRWWLVTAAAAALMGVSRLYLGRHFLADVLGGAALGCAMVAALRLSVAGERPRIWPRLLPGAFLFVAPAVLLPLAFRQGDLYAAQLWAWNLGFWLLARRGREYVGGRPGQRLARVALAVAVGGVCALVLRTTVAALPLLPAPWEALLVAFGSVVGMLTGSVLLAERLGLYPLAAVARSSE
jgi:membrane-associated phospholipid phosphatase